jgi:hypothetical protein
MGRGHSVEWGPTLRGAGAAGNTRRAWQLADKQQAAGCSHSLQGRLPVIQRHTVHTAGGPGGRASGQSAELCRQLAAWQQLSTKRCRLQLCMPPKLQHKLCGSPARHTAAAGAGKAGAAAGSRAGLDDFSAEEGTHAVHQLLLGPTAILHLRQQQCTGAVYNGRRQCITGGQAGGQGSEEEGEQAGGPSGRHGTTKVLTRQAEAASAAAATPISPAGPVCAPPTLA